MNTLPTKPPPPPPEPTEVKVIPTWRELGDRFRDVMKDLLAEGKDLERELEPRVLPALRRFKIEVEKLIAKLEERAASAGPGKRS